MSRGVGDEIGSQRRLEVGVWHMRACTRERERERERENPCFKCEAGC